MQRRDFLKNIAIAAAACIALPAAGNKLFADEAKKELTVDEMIAQITGGKGANTGKISLVAPAIAENGLVVPLKVEIDHPMEENNYVKAIYLYGNGNPTPKLTVVHLTPANGKAFYATRTKLGKSQDVVAVAELSDGTFFKDAKAIKVTIGGCG